MKEVCGFKAKDGKIYEKENDAKQADIEYELRKVINELNSLDTDLGRYIMEVKRKAHFNDFNTFIRYFDEDTVYNNIGYILRKHWSVLEKMNEIYTKKGEEYKKLYNEKNYRGFGRWWNKFFKS
jgi:hypothetical protein